MPVDRPTFSESWYRLAQLRPRLRSTVQIHRQHFRGQMWHVVQDPGSNQFFRVNTPAYHFVGMLDGRRTVSDVWRACNEQLGDAAPTQPEVIQLLGQLYTSNLLASEVPPDAQGLLNRYRKRLRREVQGYLMNLLFVRVPLLDPDHFLERWVGVFGRVFSRLGLIMWMAILAVAGYFLAGRAGELVNRAGGVLAPENLLLLYLAFIFVKVFHEFGHAFACKKFGRYAGGGEVHVMGIMMLVFTPMPYVDASSAWAFRSKWHRIVVGASGMMVELAIASIAAVVWATTYGGATPTTINALAYNVIFIASVATLLFNANPLLRFDGYYILSDILEIPNLSHRSKQYIYYLVKRYVWGVKRAQDPGNSRAERGWLLFYGLASTAYRVFICVRILLFVADKFFIAGAILAVSAVVAWVLVPLGRFVHYLLAGGELARVRTRAVATTAAFLLALVGGIGLIKAPDRYRIEGLVEPVNVRLIYPQASGFVSEIVTDSGRDVAAGEVLLRAEDLELPAELTRLRCQRKILQLRRKEATGKGATALAEMIASQIKDFDERIAYVQKRIADLDLKAPLAGRWIAPHLANRKGEYVQRDSQIGLIAGLDKVMIHAVATQEVTVADALDRVEIRIKGRPDLKTDTGVLTGTIVDRSIAAKKDLPSAALGYAVGGSMQTALGDQRGTQAAERFTEMLIRPDLPGHEPLRLLSGQRVIVRLELPPKPLAVQWYRSVLQLIQRRFSL